MKHEGGRGPIGVVGGDGDAHPHQLTSERHLHRAVALRHLKLKIYQEIKVRRIKHRAMQ